MYNIRFNIAYSNYGEIYDSPGSSRLFFCFKLVNIYDIFTTGSVRQTMISMTV